MAPSLRLLTALFGLMLVGSASAAPIQLTEAQFTTQITGLPTIVETFDGFPLGSPDSPFTIANGTYTGAPNIFFDLWCPLSQCMNSNIQDGTFNGFPAGTTFWSTKILPAGLGGDILQVTVTSNSGVLQIQFPQDESPRFIGFSDPTGLNSIDFHLIQGGTNYAFDDVTVAAAPPVVTKATSIPALGRYGLAMLTLMMLGMGWAGFRRFI